MREFATGATRDSEEGKLDYEGFLSPLVLERYAQYMNKHRVQADGKLRASDNWQKGIPRDAYMQSLWRHFFDVWKEHRGLKSREGLENALCAVIFNAMGYLFEELKEDRAAPTTPYGKTIQSWIEAERACRCQDCRCDYDEDGIPLRAEGTCSDD